MHLNRIQKLLFFNHQLKRCHCSNSPLTSAMVLEELTNRTLIRVQGEDAVMFLQGLTTNDMMHLTSRDSMYSLFLNSRGRVLYDTIIYNQKLQTTSDANPNQFLIECDHGLADALEKHLKTYRIRKKLTIEPLKGDCKVFALYGTIQISTDLSQPPRYAPVPALNLPKTDCMVYKDPRLSDLGYRILGSSESVIRESLKSAISTDLNLKYRLLRYSLGVPEGAEDIPPETSFPLESNGDYLHGISFHKGCYIGQELTARTHHTGVVRKRLMPLYFRSVNKLDSVQNIIQGGVNLGKLRGIEGDIGLALLRIESALALGEFKVGNDSLARTLRPHWWPLEAPPKEALKN